MGYGELKPGILYMVDSDGHCEKICEIKDADFEIAKEVSVEIKNLRTGNSVAITVKG